MKLSAGDMPVISLTKAIFAINCPLTAIASLLQKVDAAQ
jgi:hypothetical protein